MDLDVLQNLHASQMEEYLCRVQHSYPVCEIGKYFLGGH